MPEEENNLEEEINLTTPQDRIGHIDSCKFKCKCKLMATCAESFCLLLWPESMSTWQNPDITRKLICGNEHSAAKCELTFNDDVKHIKATNEHYQKYHRPKTCMTWLWPAIL